jgi:glutamine amidotransferase
MAYMGPEVLVAEVVLYPSRSIIKVNIPEMLPMASPRPPSCRQITVVASIKRSGRYFNQQFHRTTNSSHTLQQSYDARERRNDASLPLHLSYGNLNGDGFGIGWYPPCGPCSRHDTSPCTFTSVTPAWNNLNLSRLAKKLDSGLIFAHVRAAYPGMPVSEQNCHPFAHGQYLFMHNGVVAGFLDIRRRLLAKLSDAAYNSVQSFSSDSAVCFAVFLDQLPNLTERQPPEVLLRAIQDTIATISRIQAESGIVDISLLNFVVSDGRTMVASRFVSSDSEQPASLYFAEGSAYERSREDASAEAAEAAARAEAASAAVRAAGGEAGAAGARAEAFTGEGDYHLQYSGKGARVCLVASEPVTTSAGDWTEVPRNTALVVIREWDGELTLMQAPLSAAGDHPRLPEVQRCLEATTGVTGPPAVSMRPPPSRLVASRQLLSRENSGDYGSPETPTVTGIQHPSRIKTSRSTQSLHHANGDAGNETEGNMSHHLTGHTGPVVAFCVHGDALFSGSTDATIKVWCLKDCRYLRTLRGHRYPIRQLAIGRESGNKGHDVLLSAGAKTVRIWNLSDCSCVGVLQVADVQGSLKAFAMPSQSDDGLLYVAGQGCTVKAYDIDAADRNTISPRCMSASDNISLVYGCAAPPAAISDAAHGHCAAITSLAIAGNVIFSGGADSRIRAWNLKTLKHVHTLRGHRGSVLALCTLPGLLLSGGRDHLLRVWDLDTMVCRRSLQGHTGAVLHIATLPDARQSFGSPFLCDQSNITPSVSSIAAVVAGQSPALDPLGAEACSPTSRAHSTFFASSSDDGTVRIWSAKTFTCLHVFCCSGGGSAAVLRPAVAVCALSSAYVIAGMPDGSITLFQSEEAYADGDTAATATAAVATAAAALHKEAGTSKSAELLEPAAKRTRLEILTKATDVANEAQARSAATMRQQLDREFERALRVFTRMQTVSADPSKAEDSFRGAKFLLRLLDSLGAEVKLVQPVDGKNPVVLGRIGTDPSLPTITCYGK